MPSPIAHGLAGYAIVLFAINRRWVRPTWLLWAAALVVSVNAADLDFLPGILAGDPDRYHHGATHSLFAAVVFGVVAAGSARLVGAPAPHRVGALMAILYLSHLCFDALSIDTSPTGGMTVWWPFSPAVLTPPVDVFLDIQRDGAQGSFLLSLMTWHNVTAVVREVVLVSGVWLAYRAVVSIGPGPGRPSRVPGRSLKQDPPSA